MKMPKKIQSKNKISGFTLIELLIVIAIIGILAAVLISVINPAKQQARAKDGVTKATMGKIGLAINSYYSALNAYPTCPMLYADLSNASLPTGSACTGTSVSGDISINDVVFHYNQTYSCIRAVSQDVATNSFLWLASTGAITTLPTGSGVVAAVTAVTACPTCKPPVAGVTGVAGVASSGAVAACP